MAVRALLNQSKVHPSQRTFKGNNMNAIKSKIEMFTVALVCIAAAAAQIGLVAQSFIA
jgi:hypothetical protein